MLVGVGDLGRAVANYAGFLDRGFRIVAIFDNDPVKIGEQVGSYTIQDARRSGDLVRESSISVAMLAVPAKAAQKVTDDLVKAGIRSILCYAPTSVMVPDDVRVQYIDPVLHLQRMTYHSD